MRFIKKLLSGVLAVLLLFVIAACIKRCIRYTGFISSPDTVSFYGKEYTYLASEPNLCHLGKLEFKGGMEDEPKQFEHMLGEIQTGLYSVRGDESNRVLVRYQPNNEWYSVYRKSSLPPLDYSANNCCRIEFVKWRSGASEDHRVCGKGIADLSMIVEFLSDVRSQKTPTEAGLYNYVIQPNGFYKNCRITGTVLGYFEDEPFVCIRMDVTSYNDQAYSISIEGKEYVLPDKWVERLGISPTPR